MQQKKEIDENDLKSLYLVERLNEEMRDGASRKDAINRITEYVFKDNIRKIQYMDERLIEESALLGEHWGNDSINEWRILYANKMPVRYPYTAKSLKVFTLRDEIVERMFQSALKISPKGYPYQASLQEEIIKTKQHHEAKIENPFKQSKSGEKSHSQQKIQANMFQRMIDREKKKKEFSHLSDRDIATAIIVKNDDLRHKDLYDAWKTVHEKT